jgi:uncharacterized membrane protein
MKLNKELFGPIRDRLGSLSERTSLNISIDQIMMWVTIGLNGLFIFLIIYILLNLLLMTFQQQKAVFLWKMIKGVLFLIGVIVVSYFFEIPLNGLSSEIADVI